MLPALGRRLNGVAGEFLPDSRGSREDPDKRCEGLRLRSRRYAGVRADESGRQVGAYLPLWFRRDRPRLRPDAPPDRRGGAPRLHRQPAI